MSDSKDKKQDPSKPAAVYFKSLTIKDVKCFRGEHTIDLSDGEGRPARWTVILGNNNTGKTTILKCLAGLEATKRDEIIYYPKGVLDWSTEEAKYVESKLYRKLNVTKMVTKGTYHDYSGNWSFRGKGTGLIFSTFGIAKNYSFRVANLQIEAYGASRKMASSAFESENGEDRHASLFQNADLFNAQEWLLQLYLAKLQGNKNAEIIIEKCREVLTCGILPDVRDMRHNSKEHGQTFVHFLEFQTDFGWIRLRDLGYGYQTMLAWVLDLVRRMFERYPESPNPIREPAIVLVDEIDLHLHPEWQRKIIAHLTKYFPNTQFIVTAHSPLVVQSAEKINLVLLEKDGDHVHIRQPKIPTYQGWTLEEILSDVMGLSDRTHSEVYLGIIDRFEKAVEEEDYESAQAAHDELVKIVHPSSNVPKLMRLRMSSLVPA